MRTYEDGVGATKATSNERFDVVRCSRGGCFSCLGGDIERGFVFLVSRAARVSSTVHDNTKRDGTNHGHRWVQGLEGRQAGKPAGGVECENAGSGFDIGICRRRELGFVGL